VISWLHGIELVFGLAKFSAEFKDVIVAGLVWAGFPHLEKGFEALDFLEFPDEAILVDAFALVVVEVDSLSAHAERSFWARFSVSSRAMRLAVARSSSVASRVWGSLS
jgi:hypothetical protein